MACAAHMLAKWWLQWIFVQHEHTSKPAQLPLFALQPFPGQCEQRSGSKNAMRIAGIGPSSGESWAATFSFPTSIPWSLAQ